MFQKLKFIQVCFIVTLMLLFVGCSYNGSNEDKVYSLIVPDGTPAINLGGVFSESNVKATIVSGPSLLSSAFIKNEYDAIVAPVILGTKLYSLNKSNYRLARIITTGNNYLVSRSGEPITSIEDVSGKTVCAYGENNTPDFILKQALKSKNIDCIISYESSVNDVFTNGFLTNKYDYYLLAEPVISKIKVSLKLDIQVLNLEKVVDVNNYYPQAGLFVKEGVNTNNFLKLAESNYSKMITDLNGYVDKLLSLDKEVYPTFSKLGKDVLLQAVPNACLSYDSILKVQQEVITYFELLNKFNPQILGGTIPDELFFYQS